MKKMGNLLADLGFKKESSVHTQRAFFKHLVRAATPPNVQNLDLFSELKKSPASPTEQAAQLAFDPHVLKAGNK